MEAEELDNPVPIPPCERWGICKHYDMCSSERLNCLSFRNYVLNKDGSYDQKDIGVKFTPEQEYKCKNCKKDLKSDAYSFCGALCAFYWWAKYLKKNEKIRGNIKYGHICER